MSSAAQQQECKFLKASLKKGGRAFYALEKYLVEIESTKKPSLVVIWESALLLGGLIEAISTYLAGFYQSITLVDPERSACSDRLVDTKGALLWESEGKEARKNQFITPN